uniref:Putative mucin n=1 Tax=Ornithodoros turicata TaxID=34597 RepID=A0A2R5L5P6_9ACAR
MPSSGKSRRHRKSRATDSKHGKTKGGTHNHHQSQKLHIPVQDTPPLPADAMEVTTPLSSIVEPLTPVFEPNDPDNPAFNTFNYWKTPFPSVDLDVLME